MRGSHGGGFKTFSFEIIQVARLRRPRLNYYKPFINGFEKNIYIGIFQNVTDTQTAFYLNRPLSLLLSPTA